MSSDIRANLNDQISREAAEWLIEFRTGDIDPAGRKHFDAWLRASPEHVRAFIEMAALWQEGGAIDPRRRLNVEAMIARAQSEQNIAPMSSTSRGGLSVSAPPAPALPITLAHEARESVRSGRVRPSQWAVAAGLLIAALAMTSILRSRLPSRPTYTTGVGVRQSIALPDGSKVLLDSDSQLRVSFTVAMRKVELLQGQALFYVVKNPRQPFLVDAGRTVVRDVGTVFDVNRLGNGTIVTVVQGRVAVAMPPNAEARGTKVGVELQPGDDATGIGVAGRKAAPTIYLSTGEQVDMHVGHSPPRAIRVDVDSETAWTHGEVVLESATLAEVAQVFNRYSARRLVAEDLGKKPLRLSGVFSTNPDFLIRYLRGRQDITVRETDSEIGIVRNPTR